MSDDTHAKPQTEVQEELQEALSILELPNTPRPEKLRRERAYFDGAHEVRFTERTFRPKHAADIDEIRAFVDSLEIRRRAVAPLPEPIAPAAPHVAPKVPDHYRTPLEGVIQGALVSVETVHRVGTGTVVDVVWEDATGGLTRGLFLVDDGTARPYEEVTSKVDELPPPRVPTIAPVAPEVPPAAPPAPLTAPEMPKKRLLGFGKKKEGPVTDAADAAPSPAPNADVKKRRFGFGKK